jgi:hypothetical protein
MGGITDMFNSFFRFISSFLVYVLAGYQQSNLPPIVMGAMAGSAIGIAEYISIAVAMVMVMTAAIWHRKIHAAVKAVVVYLVLVAIGGGIFFTFLDSLRAASSGIVTWMLGENTLQFTGIITSGNIGDVFAAAVGVGVASYYVLFIVVLLYILTMFEIIGTLLTLPLLVLATVSGFFKKWFDWLVAVMLFAIFIGPPAIIGVLLLGQKLNEWAGFQNSAFLAIVAIVASLAFTRHWITSVLKSTKSIVSRITDNISVRGRVKTDNRPAQVDGKTASDRSVANQQVSRRQGSSMVRRVGSIAMAEGALAVAVKLGAMPITITTKVAHTAAKAVHAYYSKNVGLPPNRTMDKASGEGSTAAEDWTYLHSHAKRSGRGER